MSSTYLSHIDDFSDVDHNAISSRYSMYMLAKTADNGEEGRRTYRPKRCEYINKDKDSSPNILNDKNHQASSQKVRQLRSNSVQLLM